LADEIPGQQRLRRGGFTLGAGDAREFKPVPFIQRGAVDYAKKHGQGSFPSYREMSRLNTLQDDPERGHATYLAYRDAMKSPDEAPGIRESYGHMASEIEAQFEHMTKPTHEGGMGMKYESLDHDPYANTQELHDDISKGNIKVLGTRVTGPHAFFTDEQNDKFRAVHDVFGHGALGRGFSRHGEEAVWRMHSHLFSDAAQPALAADLRNQNQFYNYQPKGGDFAAQDEKLIGLPHWAQETGPLNPEDHAKPAPRTQHFEQGRFDF
jgi:hypothetical protein